MKLYVYAICKNEKKFAARWMQSMGEADGVYVLDTGSEDGTPEELARLGAYVACKTIEPWRFDTARNSSLELVPQDADLCICTDLDEVFEPGWREKLEKAAREHPADQYKYRYVWSHTENGGEGLVFWHDKIHTRQNFRWHYPVHEVLNWQPERASKVVVAPGVALHHWPVPDKPRSQYLPLLELAAREEPQDCRCAHYLGREYMYHGQWAQAVEELRRHLTLPGSTWEAERSASMRYLARCYEAMHREREALRWLYRAIAEAPALREGYVECAQFYYSQGNWPGVLLMCESALAITERSTTYLNEAFAWGAAPWDLAAQAAWHLGCGAKARDYGKQALQLELENARLQDNQRFYEALAEQQAGTVKNG